MADTPSSSPDGGTPPTGRWVLPRRAGGCSDNLPARTPPDTNPGRCECGHPRGWHIDNRDVCTVLECRCTHYTESPAPSSSGETPALAYSAVEVAERIADNEACIQPERHIRRWAATVRQRDAEIARLRAEVERWQRAFQHYSGHDADCPRIVAASPCKCGYLDLALAAATPPAGDARGS